MPQLRRAMEIRVEGSIDQAMRVLKRKLAKEGVFKQWKKRAFYEKPSVRRKRKRVEAQRRRRKEERRRRPRRFDLPPDTSDGYATLAKPCFSGYPARDRATP